MQAVGRKACVFCGTAASSKSYITEFESIQFMSSGSKYKSEF